MKEDPGFYEEISFAGMDVPVLFHQDRLSAQSGSDHFDCHWHDRIELLYITEGELAVRCNTQNYLGRAGDLIVVNSNELHEGRCLRGSAEYFCIIFDPPLLQGGKNDACEMKYIDPIFQNRILFCNKIENDPVIGSYIRRFAEEYEAKKIGYEIAVKAAIFELLLYLLRNHVSKALTPPAYEAMMSQLKRTNKILKYVEEHCSEEITLDSVCEMANVSRYYFCRLFKAATGYTFNDFRNRQRIQKAEIMLKTGNVNVTEAALACGFNDTNYFSRLFRRYRNIPPSRVGKQ